MAKQEIKTLSKEMENGQIKVVKEVVEMLTEVDIQQRRSQLGYQASDIKRQISQLTDMYNQTLSDIAECDTMLTQFEAPIKIEE